MENKKNYTHKEVKEMFEAYRNLELARSMHENNEKFRETLKEVQKYSKIAREKIPEEIQITELGDIL